jgi:hypothetical protein
MDYPHPYIKMNDVGEIDLSEAYDTGIGEWDKIAIRFGYGNEAEALEEGISEGYMYLTDRDARPQGGAHPQAHLWDNGATSNDELKRILTIRRAVLDRLSEKALPEGMPYSYLEEIMVPMYLMHRYQTEATAKLLGGMYYNYKVKGDNQPLAKFIPAGLQMDALESLLLTLEPEHLRLSEELLQKILPKAPGYSRGQESFDSKTSVTWDYTSAMSAAIQGTVALILHPERSNRVVNHHIRDNNQPSLQSILTRLIESTWESPSTTAHHRYIERLVEWEVMDGMIALANHQDAHPETRSLVRYALEGLSERISALEALSESDTAHYNRALNVLENWLDEPDEYQPSPDVRVPDGSPIGMETFCVFH